MKRHDGLGYSIQLARLSFWFVRYAEHVGLTKKDFDFTINTITVNKTWAYKKTTGAGFAPTKNEQSKRSIIIYSVTMQHFKGYQ